MKKILGCIFCLVMLFVSTISFGGEVSIATLVESVKVMDMELTQGDQDALVLSVQSAINQKIAVASADQNMKATIDQVYQLVDASIPRLDAEKATKVVDDYCDLLMVYFETGNMALKDVQSATDKVLNLSGTKVIKQEGINQEHIKALLKEVTDKNALLQGQVGVEYQQVLKVANLDKMLLNVEKAYRVVNSEFNTYGSFKELGRSLQKQLVLLASTENVDLTLEADVVARLRKDNIGISVNHNGIIYQIPTAFLEKHIGDLKISIKPVAVDATTATAVTGGMIKPLLLREVSVGHATNPESIMVHVPVSALQSDALVVESYALMAGKGDQWQKLVADMNYGTLTATIKASGLMGAGTYQATYMDLAGHWAERNITDLLAHGIAVDNNLTNYAPNAVMTRGEFVRMLINIIGTEGKSANIFTDVAAGSAYSDIIESVIYYGLTIGVSDNKFAPETALTREDMVTLASKMFEIKNGYALDGGFLRFKDMNEIAAYAKDAVTAMEAAGYVSGYDDNTFQPKKTVTKAEAVSVLNKMLK